ncbi:MAG: kynureninase, partial [Ktedonobacterales bacterium]|nr:kynureninase [Ktedonobacterales bacterium]
MVTPLLDDRAHASALDARDPLAVYRERFYLPAGKIYLDGNSLGLPTRAGEAALLRAMEQWKTLGIDGWTGAAPPWFTLGEDLGALMAPLVGAAPATVVATGTTTVNLHALVATFYHPQGTRRRIVCAAPDFPSDRYALASQVALHGGDALDLVAVPERAAGFLDEADIIAAFTDEVALALLPGALYRSGQLLDMPRLTVAAHARGILIGFDGAHAVGAVPHELDAWGVDFAFWCGYKYLNGGPGSTAGLYVHPRHHDRLPALRGWWGYQKDRQFDMAPDFVGAAGAGAWQISTPSVFAAAPLYGSLALFAEVGLASLRAKSLALTDYLIALVDELGEQGYGVGTPREHARRGGHVAVTHPDAARIGKALKAHGVIPDFRPPDVLRLAPIAFYTSFVEVWEAAQQLRAIVQTGA